MICTRCLRMKYTAPICDEAGRWIDHAGAFGQLLTCKREHRYHQTDCDLRGRAAEDCAEKTAHSLQVARMLIRRMALNYYARAQGAPAEEWAPEFYHLASAFIGPEMPGDYAVYERNIEMAKARACTR